MLLIYTGNFWDGPIEVLPLRSLFCKGFLFFIFNIFYWHQNLHTCFLLVVLFFLLQQRHRNQFYVESEAKSGRWGVQGEELGRVKRTVCGEEINWKTLLRSVIDTWILPGSISWILPSAILHVGFLYQPPIFTWVILEMLLNPFCFHQSLNPGLIPVFMPLISINGRLKKCNFLIRPGLIHPSPINWEARSSR